MRVSTCVGVHIGGNTLCRPEPIRLDEGGLDPSHDSGLDPADPGLGAIPPDPVLAPDPDNNSSRSNCSVGSCNSSGDLADPGGDSTGVRASEMFDKLELALDLASLESGELGGRASMLSLLTTGAEKDL